MSILNGTCELYNSRQKRLKGLFEIENPGEQELKKAMRANGWKRCGEEMPLDGQVVICVHGNSLPGMLASMDIVKFQIFYNTSSEICATEGMRNGSFYWQSI